MKTRLYLTGMEMEEGDLFTSHSNPSFSRLFYIQSIEDGQVLVRDLLSSKPIKMTNDKFKVLKNGKLKQVELVLTMRKGEWLTLFARFEAKINNNNLLDMDYEVPEGVLQVWKGEKEVINKRIA